MDVEVLDKAKDGLSIPAKSKDYSSSTLRMAEE